MITLSVWLSLYRHLKNLLLSFFLTCNLAAIQAQPTLVFNPFIQNLSRPVEITNANDGSGRLFIIEQDGLIKIWKNGHIIGKPFLDLSGIVPRGKEYEGLFSIAFSPDYKQTGFFFVFYTTRNEATMISRFKTSKNNPDSAIAGSAVTLFSFSAQEGNGPHFGDLHFGKDGYLYIMISDISRPGIPNKFAQNGQSLFGKLLRIDTKVVSAPYYSIPPDNPYINNDLVRDEIVCLGFRNAWRWSFDRNTGDMWIADVGEDRWEEVDFKKAGKLKPANYGWSCYEGNAGFNTTGCAGRNNYLFPIFTYPHNNNTGGYAVTGGYVYRGTSYPSLNGYYICADYVSGNAWKIRSDGFGGWNISEQNNIPKGITGFGEDDDGELYAVTLQGTVYRVQSAADAFVSAINKH
jgi:glucose/arabinose dehydrogenase